MEISLANAKKLNWLWQDEHEIEWIETFVKIIDKSGKTVPFKLTPEQKAFINGLAHKNVISKSRQLGLSVCCAGISIRRCVCHPNTTCVLISHSQESTNKVFGKLKQMFYSLPDCIRPELLTNNRQELSFVNGSRISCQTAGNKDLCRGDTINGVLHMSEYAMWKNQEGQMQSLMQAVTESATCIIESTTKGFNSFTSTYMQARNGENDFKPFFFNWINGRTLFEPQYKLAVKSWKARHNGKMLTEDEYDEEEKSLAKLGMTPEQAVWRRGKISESSLDAFHEEFPSTFEESCIVSGSSVFDNNKVIRLQQAIVQQNIKPLSLDKIVGIPQVLRPHVSNRNLKVWQIPKKGIRYVLGCDVAEGLGGKRDSSTIYVSDKDGVEVAEFKSNKVKPYELADIIDAMGRWYNKGLLVVEKASGGHSCIERLRYDKKYMNMYKYKCYDEFKRTIWKVGFDTNNKTKSIAVNDMREWFDKGLIDIQSNDLLEEMKTFVAEDNGAFTVDYEIIDRVNKFGDAYEAIYVDNGTIKSKVLDNACSYPVYDDMGEYIAFIEHWTDAYTAISFWNVYYPTYVEHWDNGGGEMRLTSTDNSVGLPIHYHNFNDEDYNFGVALLNDIKPIMDALEDVMAKMSDSIYVNVMNPMPVAIGQRIESSIPADAVGYVMNLDVGDFKYANCSLDYNSIKLYLDNMKQFLNDVACMPSVLGSSTNIANISEVSMQILLMMASVYADENKKWLNIGFQKRFEMFKKILGMQGIKVDSDVEVIYNVAMPVASTEMIANLKALQEMGAISRETIMEKTEYVSDVEVEKKRLSGENVSQNVSQKVDNPSKEVEIK